MPQVVEGITGVSEDMAAVPGDIGPDSTPPVWWVGHWWPNGAATAAGGPLVAHPRCAIWG